MKVRMECIPCYLKQVLSAVKIGGYSEEKANEVFYQAMRIIPEMNTAASPAENSTIALLEAYKAMRMDDPFKQAKKESNDLAMKLYNRMAQLVKEADDPLLTVFKISVAGNIIDMGITPDFDINVALNEITSKEFDHCDYDKFNECLEAAQNIMILGDNSGEIVFDKLLVEVLKSYNKNVTYVVKNGPILNDATMEDAIETGMSQITEVITNGANFLGTVVHECSHEFIDRFEKSDLVIGKGQANFESLEGSKFAGDKTFFVLRAKCDLVADCAGAKLGEILFIRNKVKETD
ncbi:ARMT1-like domain-containing protein [Petroclostridium sp. X23]|uniref:damage-control phosphatase ARMT1 family protein n=1 Tax=Petroclostridium sp. X23 TaxID=3045146 RepID=UPI0024AD2A21|nr:ARMT1-like domain-containing protein [Petroclostridium sp. X23]WHH59517.1 ARMT1-like domain-containing protein [Petroclostridium sp. X23]